MAVIALCGLALIPLAISQNGTGHDSWIASAPLGMRLRQIVPQFLIGTGAPARTVLRDAAIALVVIALALLAADGPSALRRGAGVAAGLALAGFALSLLLIAVGFDDLITRNILALWLPAALVVAAGLSVRRFAPLGIAAAVALCAIGVTAAVGVAAERNLQRPDWRYVARALGTVPTPRRGIAGRAILIQHYRTLLPLSLYLPGLRVMPAAGARVTELDVIAMSSPQEPLCWWGAACNLIPSRMQRRYARPRLPRRLDAPRAAVHDQAARRPPAGPAHAGPGRPGPACHEAAPRRPGAAARLRASTSAPLRRRWAPGASAPSVSGPKATRSSERTGWPTASHIRLTCRFRPSWMVSSRTSRSRPSRRTRAGAVRPSSSSTPLRSARRARSETGARVDDGAVGARHLEAGVGEPVGQVAVVGEQDEPGGVDVEPAHGIQADRGGHERDHRRTALGIAGRRHDARPAC